jgi:hypothetical protein
MDNERLQEIKDGVPTKEENISTTIWRLKIEKDELITAYESAQAELVEVKETIRFRAWRDGKGSAYIDLTDLRAQLDKMLKIERKLQAEHSISMDYYEKKLSEAQAEVEFWKYEMPELREDEL